MPNEDKQQKYNDYYLVGNSNQPINSPTQTLLTSQNKEIENRIDVPNHQCVTPKIQQTKSNTKSVPNKQLAQIKKSKIVSMPKKVIKTYQKQMPVKHDVSLKQPNKPQHSPLQKSECKKKPLHNWVGRLPLIYIPAPSK